MDNTDTSNNDDIGEARPPTPRTTPTSAKHDHQHRYEATDHVDVSTKLLFPSPSPQNCYLCHKKNKNVYIHRENQTLTKRKMDCVRSPPVKTVEESESESSSSDSESHDDVVVPAPTVAPLPVRTTRPSWWCEEHVESCLS